MHEGRVNYYNWERNPKVRHLPIIFVAIRMTRCSHCGHKSRVCVIRLRERLAKRISNVFILAQPFQSLEEREDKGLLRIVRVVAGYFDESFTGGFRHHRVAKENI